MLLALILLSFLGTNGPMLYFLHRLRHDRKPSVSHHMATSKRTNLVYALGHFVGGMAYLYFAYKYFINSDFGFGKAANEANQITQEAAYTVRTIEDDQMGNDQQNYPENMGEQNNDSYTNKLNEEAKKANDSQAQFSTKSEMNSEKGQYLVWTANDYTKGDIGKGTYKVKDGDTLWEIAEAVYGDGSLWVNILAANTNSVDFLANGQQALIYAGQTITIP
jgi:nucleoid-associated protein YgaU